MVKGALIMYTSARGTPVPNVVLFQFNPTTLRHSLQPRLDADDVPEANPLATKGPPIETFSFSLSMNAHDSIADDNAVVAGEADDLGLYGRLAALETLLHPTDNDDGLADPSGGDSPSTPAATVPAVLFVWGKGRMIPVRVMSLSVTERLYDDQLNPTHADADIELQVLSPGELKSVQGPLAELMTAAYNTSQVQREARVLRHLGSSAQAATGLLPDLPTLG